MKLVHVIRSNDNKHKFTAKLEANKKEYLVKFGAKGYEDYTTHKDPERKKRYLKRHESREDWTVQGVLTPGFWSRWVLWNKTDLAASIADARKRFNL